MCDPVGEGECVYPLSPVKVNVGRLCEKLKSAMRSCLKQRCDGNLLAIFAGVSIGEKPVYRNLAIY